MATRSFDDVVPKYTMLQPDVEDVIYADELEDGMIALLVPTYRQEERDTASMPGVLLKNNRWCRVTKLRKNIITVETNAKSEGDFLVVDGKAEIVDSVVFIAEYVDGHKDIRKSDATWGWIVIKDRSTTLEEVTERVRESNRELQKFSRIK